MIYYQELDTEPLRNFHDERRLKYNKTFTHTNDFFDVSENQIVFFALMDMAQRLTPIYNEINKLPDINATMYPDIYDQRFFYLECYSNRANKFTATQFYVNFMGLKKL